VQRGAHMLQLDVDGTWTDTMEVDMGDWSYFGITVGVAADRATVIESNDDRVRVAFQWDAFDLSSFSGGGVSYRDNAQGLNYAQGAVNPNWKRIASVVLVKTIMVQRGEPGYYVGWHSTPYVGLPNALQGSADGESTDYGERELGLGGGTAVAWSSSGRIARWPAWADDVDGKWTANGLAATANKIWWPGIKDPRYAPYNTAGWIAVQGDGYPSMQSAGPYYVGDIHYSNGTAKFLASRIPREIGVWKVGTRGGVVLHFSNEDHSPSGIPYQYQAFIGVVAYTADSSSTFANEPSEYIQDQIEALVEALEWPKV
jgi:hypothetical protein